MALEATNHTSALRVARSLTPVAVAVILTAAVTGCSAGHPAPGATPHAAVATYRAPSAYRVDESNLRRLTDELPADSPQRQLLADGQVSRTEIEQAWTAYAACITKVGFTVSAPVWDPVTNAEMIYTYRRPGAARPSSARGAQQPQLTADEARLIDDCEANTWFPVSAIYTADAPNHMTPLLAGAMVGCMSQRGYDVRGSSSFAEVVGARGGYAEGARVAAARSCLSTAMAAHYPDLPYHPDP